MNAKMVYEDLKQQQPASAHTFKKLIGWTLHLEYSLSESNCPDIV